MESTRLSQLWKKVASALDRVADGRVRPVRPWHEAEAPEGEEPHAIQDPNEPEADEAEPDADDAPEQLTESEHPADASVEEMARQELQGEGWLGGKELDDAWRASDEYRSRQDVGEAPSVANTMLLDPSERKRVVDLFSRWDEDFLAEHHKATGVPESVRERTMANKENESIKAMHADAVKRIEAEEAKKAPSGLKLKSLYKELDAIVDRMSSFNKKYGPEAIESERKQNLINLSEGETASEREQVAPYQFPGEMEKTPESAAAEEATARANKELEAAGGLAGQLLSKKDSVLSDAEKENLGVVLQSLAKLFSKRELRGDQEKIVQKMIRTLRRLTDKFSNAINSDAELKRQMKELASSVAGAASREESARQSSMSSWHGGNALKIAIAARLNVSAGGSKYTLRDRLVTPGRKLVHTKPMTALDDESDASLSSSGFSPRTAFDEMVLKGPARHGLDAAIKAAVGALYGSNAGDPEEIFQSAAEVAFGLLKDDYERLSDLSTGDFRGTLTEQHTVYDPENPAGRAEKPAEKDLKASFVREYISLANAVFSRFVETSEAPGGTAYDPDTGAVSSLPPHEDSDVVWNPETEQYELTPEEPYAESRTLTEEEKAAKSKDVVELRAKEAAPLTRDVLYDDDGVMKDVKVLLSELPARKLDELRGVIEGELDALSAVPAGKMTEDLKDDLNQLSDSLELLAVREKR